MVFVGKMKADPTPELSDAVIARLELADGTARVDPAMVAKPTLRGSYRYTE